MPPSFTGIPYITYYATKAGILQLTQSIALQYAGKDIRANVILPGLVDTPMIREPLKDAYADGDVEKMIEIRNQQCLMKRMGDALDVASRPLIKPVMARFTGTWATPKPFSQLRSRF